EIERLLAEDAAKHKQAIIELSKAMYVMSPFTSLLVLESEAMYQQYKVDRGRKDHWAMYDCPEKIDVVAEDEDGNRIDPKKLARPTPKQVMGTIGIRNLSSSEIRRAKASRRQLASPARLYREAADGALAKPNKSSNVTALMQQFKAYYRQGKYSEAEMYAHLAAEMDPDASVPAAAVVMSRTQA